MKKNKKRLIVIEGFDRCGKDTLLSDLEKLHTIMPHVYIMKNDLTGLPSYEHEQEDFLTWLNRYIDFQVNEINRLFNDYDTIIMSRFILSDEVYSVLFNREYTTRNYLNRLIDCDIYNFCINFDNYQEYLDRIHMIGNSEVQYDEEYFNKITTLYNNISSNIFSFINDNNLNIMMDYCYLYIKSTTTRLEILKNFLYEYF